MPGAEAGGFLCHRCRYWYCSNVFGMEQDPPVIAGELRVSLTQRMYQNLSKSKNRRDDPEVALIDSAKERAEMREITRMLFDEVNQRSSVNSYDRTAERVYPFHDERSWLT